MSHTPGPWHWVNQAHWRDPDQSDQPWDGMTWDAPQSFDVLQAADGDAVLDGRWHNDNTAAVTIRTAADAHLIAAAPDLLEALRIAAIWTNPNSLGEPSPEEYAAVLAAIAKAEGRE